MNFENYVDSIVEKLDETNHPIQTLFTTQNEAMDFLVERYESETTVEDTVQAALLRVVSIDSVGVEQ